MKKILLFVSVMAILTACKKDNDAEPELSARVSGTYKASKFEYGGVNLPLTGGTELKLVFDKATAETVSGKLQYKVEGVSEPDESLGTLIVKDAGESGVDLYESSTRVGNVNKSNQLTLSGSADGVFFEIIAQKQ